MDFEELSHRSREMPARANGSFPEEDEAKASEDHRKLEVVMADPSRRYSGNAAGNFFVDETCIDCDLCRQIAPGIFTEEADHSIVCRQPADSGEELRASMALVACPTGSIGTRQKIDIRRVLDAFPERLDDNVYFCGYASADSFGAASYLIVRPEGNVMIDSPRFAKNLVGRIDALGGVRTMFFTHRDDVADHEKYHRHFGCRRIIHAADDAAVHAEQTLSGNDPVALSEDLLAIPVPGHTRGHVVLLYRNKYLFTGDHLAWSERRGRLIGFRNATWYSWREQTRSMERLLEHSFEWVLPGHGRRAVFPAEVMREKLRDCVEWMKETGN
jgi:glyoxylase-like metal-dependent hydrolase (beta-lactamase superfamily II)/ferredoxin